MTVTTIDVGGVRFQSTRPSEAISQVLELTGGARQLPVRFSNAYCVARSRADPEYRELLNSRGLVFPDGVPVLFVMRVKAWACGAERRPGLVRGPTFFRDFLDRCSEEKLNFGHFFLGGTDSVLREIESAATIRLPPGAVKGSYSPPYKPLSEEYLVALANIVNAAQTDIVWVGMGSPKQDFVASFLSRKCGVTAIGVGAAFDFYAGSVTEAPVWMRGSGLEWVFRLLREPRRLWRRYARSATTFGVVAARESTIAVLAGVRRRLWT